MRIEVVTPPRHEPLRLEDAKDFLAVDYSEEDGLIRALVTAAREHVEELSGRALAEQTLRLVLDRFPARGVLPLPRPPLVEVEEIEYLDPEGVWRTSPPELYDVDTGSSPGSVYAPHGWPATAERPGAVRITYRAGYDAEGGEQAPERLVVAMRQLVRHWYDQRVPVAVGTTAMEIPHMLGNLIAPIRFRYSLPD